MLRLMLRQPPMSIYPLSLQVGGFDLLGELFMQVTFTLNVGLTSVLMRFIAVCSI